MKPFRILSIDGGGMKGLYAASYLQTLEAHFSVDLHTHFDLIAGTSTGGIIALGLASGKRAAELKKFYVEHGPRIFPERQVPKIPILRELHVTKELIKGLRNGYSYDSHPLKMALTEVLKRPDGQPLRMQDAQTRLLIPAINAQNAYPRVFKAHHNEPQVAHLTRDQNITMADVALATAAAPWYLPIARVEEDETPFTYVDGGLWANNPSVVAVTEALTYYVGPDKPFSHIELISIGLPSAVGFTNDGKYGSGAQFILQLLAYSMEASKIGADQTSKFLLKEAPNLYYRVKPQNLTEAQSLRLRLDASSDDAIGELQMLGRDQAQNDKNLPSIQQLFKKLTLKE